MSEPRDENPSADPSETTTTDWSAEQEIERDDDPGEQLQPGEPEVEYPPPGGRFTSPRPQE